MCGYVCVVSRNVGGREYGMRGSSFDEECKNVFVVAGCVCLCVGGGFS